MNWDRIREKLSILSDAAKYDVSCSSSGSKRKNNGGLGDTTGMGICHSYTEDGRCISLLKILLTNFCIFDCAYCVSRKSNDAVKRVAFTVEEVVDLTVSFYRRNYIEGLFLSSGIFGNPDYTMERLVRIARTLREDHQFNGYIHLKTIPGASPELIREAGLYADRLSVNIELPSEQSLALLAPDKNMKDIEQPMELLQDAISESKEARKKSVKAVSFAPAGQSTQMVIGATPESDRQIILKADSLYKGYSLRRVYYSGYVPVNGQHANLPSLQAAVPALREHRLYQADWLMRFYGFGAEEITDANSPNLDTAIDPKLGWALRHLALFPVDVNTADYEMILRIPGVGVGSAKKIIQARAFGPLGWEQLKKIGIAVNRARYFLVCREAPDHSLLGLPESTLRQRIVGQAKSKFQAYYTRQGSLFG